MALYAFDGTLDDGSQYGTDITSIGEETNVWRFFSAYDGNTKGGGTKNVYETGVGTRFGLIGEVAGGAFGAGWLSRIDAAYDTLCRNYINGDHVIDVVGFSRGAALALGFVNKIHDDGIAQDDRTIAPAPEVRFLALFDVVAAFDFGILGPWTSKFQPLHPVTLPPNVKRTYHAMALDERRHEFDGTRVAGAYEVWFRGVHSDIGGGNGNLGLSGIALRWMFRKAMLCGLPITELNLNAGHDGCRPADAIRPNPFSKVSLFWRTVGPADLVHYTVAQHIVLPGEDCDAVPATCPIETQALEQTRTDPPAVVTT